MTTLRKAVILARDTFLEYADKHDRKGTEEGKRKAQENRAIACKMDEALQQPDPLELLEELAYNFKNIPDDVWMSANRLFEFNFSFYDDGWEFLMRKCGEKFIDHEEGFDNLNDAIHAAYAKAKELYPELDWRH